MAAKERMFLLDNGIVIVRNSDGQELGFNSVSDFNQYYPGIDLSGKKFIDYEYNPEGTRNIYIDSEDPSISIGSAPNALFEDIIDSFNTLVGNVADPYYGITDLNAAKIIKRDTCKAQARAVFRGKYDDEAIEDAMLGILSQAEIDQIKADRQAIKAAYLLVKNEVIAATTIPEVIAITPVWPSI